MSMKETSRKQPLTRDNSFLSRNGTRQGYRRSFSLQENSSPGSEEASKPKKENEVLSRKENGRKHRFTRSNSALSRNGTHQGYRRALSLQENSGAVFRDINSCWYRERSVNLLDTSGVQPNGTNSQYQSRGLLKVLENNVVPTRCPKLQCHKGILPSSRLKSPYLTEKTTLVSNKASKPPFMNSSQSRMDASGSVLGKTKKQRVSQLSEVECSSNPSSLSDSSAPYDDLELDLISSISSGMCEQELQDLNLLPDEFLPEKWIITPLSTPERFETVADGGFEAFDGSRFTPIQEASLVLNKPITDECASVVDEEAETSSEDIDLFESLRVLEMSGKDMLQIQDGNVDSMLAMQFSCAQFCDPWAEDIKSTSEEMAKCDKCILEGSTSEDSCFNYSSFENLPTQNNFGTGLDEVQYLPHCQEYDSITLSDLEEHIHGKISNGTSSHIFENEANKIADQLVALAAQSSVNSSCVSVYEESRSIFTLEQSLMQSDELNGCINEELLFSSLTLNSHFYDENNLESSLYKMGSGAGQLRIEKETFYKDKLYDLKNEYSTVPRKNVKSMQCFGCDPISVKAKYSEQLLFCIASSNVNSDKCMNSANDRLSHTFFNFPELQTGCFETSEDSIEILVGMKEFDGQEGLGRITNEAISSLCESDARENFYSNVNCASVLHDSAQKESVWVKAERTSESISSQSLRSSLNCDSGLDSSTSSDAETVINYNSSLVPTKATMSPFGSLTVYQLFEGNQVVGLRDCWLQDHGGPKIKNREDSGSDVKLHSCVNFNRRCNNKLPIINLKQSTVKSMSGKYLEKGSIQTDTCQTSRMESSKSESERNSERPKAYLFEQEKGIEGHKQEAACESGLIIGISGNHMSREKQLYCPVISIKDSTECPETSVMDAVHNWIVPGKSKNSNDFKGESLNWLSVLPCNGPAKIGHCLVLYTDKNDISALYFMMELHQKQGYISDLYSSSVFCIKHGYLKKDAHSAVESCMSFKYHFAFKGNSGTGKFDIIPIQVRECSGWTHDLEKYIGQFQQFRRTGNELVPRNFITIETEIEEMVRGYSVRIILGVNLPASSCFLVYRNHFGRDNCNSDESLRAYSIDLNDKLVVEYLRKYKLGKDLLPLFIDNRDGLKLCHAEQVQNVYDVTKDEVFELNDDPSDITISCIQWEGSHIAELTCLSSKLHDDLSSSDQIEIQEGQLNCLQILESDFIKEVDSISTMSVCDPLHLLSVSLHSDLLLDNPVVKGCFSGISDLNGVKILVEDNLHMIMQCSESGAGNAIEPSSCKCFELHLPHRCEECQGLQINPKYNATLVLPNVGHEDCDSVTGVKFGKMDKNIYFSEKGKTKETVFSGLSDGAQCNHKCSQDNLIGILHKSKGGIEAEEIKTVAHIHHDDNPIAAPMPVTVLCLADSEDLLLSGRCLLLQAGRKKESFEYNSQYIKGLAELEEDGMERKVEMLESELLEVKKQNHKLESLLKRVLRRTDVMQQSLLDRKRYWHRRRHVICRFSLHMRKKKK